MVIGPLLGAGASLAGVLMQSGAQQDQTNLGYLNLYEQKRQARVREALAKATRSDAYGNKVVYKPGVGFITETTPLTAAILGAQQKEQLAQFRDDAPRARAAAERVDKRSIQAGDVYNDLFNRYKYGRRKSQQEYVAEAIRNAVAGQRDRRGKDVNGIEAISNVALRTGNSGALPKLIAAARRGRDDLTLSEVIANAKKEGKQQYLAERNADLQSTFGELNQLRSIADQTVQPNLNWNNENAALSGRQDNALTQLIQTNLQNSNAVGDAYNQVAQFAGQSPNFGPLSGALSKINLPQGKSAQEQKLANLILQQKMGSAQIGIHRNNAELAKYRGNIGTF